MHVESNDRNTYSISTQCSSTGWIWSCMQIIMNPPRVVCCVHCSWRVLEGDKVLTDRTEWKELLEKCHRSVLLEGMLRGQSSCGLMPAFFCNYIMVNVIFKTPQRDCGYVFKKQTFIASLRWESLVSRVKFRYAQQIWAVTLTEWGFYSNELLPTCICLTSTLPPKENACCVTLFKRLCILLNIL